MKASNSHVCVLASWLSTTVTFPIVGCDPGGATMLRCGLWRGCEGAELG
jgi:hypothetical protein